MFDTIVSWRKANLRESLWFRRGLTNKGNNEKKEPIRENVGSIELSSTEDI